MKLFLLLLKTLKPIFRIKGTLIQNGWKIKNKRVSKNRLCLVLLIDCGTKITQLFVHVAHNVDQPTVSFTKIPRHQPHQRGSCKLISSVFLSGLVTFDAFLPFFWTTPCQSWVWFPPLRTPIGLRIFLNVAFLCKSCSKHIQLIFFSSPGHPDHRYRGPRKEKVFCSRVVWRYPGVWDKVFSRTFLVRLAQIYSFIFILLTNSCVNFCSTICIGMLRLSETGGFTFLAPYFWPSGRCAFFKVHSVPSTVFCRVTLFTHTCV